MRLRTQWPFALGLIVILESLLGCGGVNLPVDPGTPGTPNLNPKFAADIAPIFDVSCAMSGCHAKSHPAKDLPLTATSSYDNTVGIPSTEQPGILLVKPGDPDNSYLYQKLIETAATGDVMPPAGRLSSAQIQTIRAWIANGANKD